MRRRNSLRLSEYDYATPGAYFVTVCTRGRELLGRITVGEVELTDIGRIVEGCWLRLPRHLPSVELDAFVIMPDHGIVMLVPRGEASLAPYMSWSPGSRRARAGSPAAESGSADTTNT